MWKAKNARDPPRASSLGMAVVIKAGDMPRILTVVQTPRQSLPFTERQLGELCARGEADGGQATRRIQLVPSTTCRAFRSLPSRKPLVP